MGHGTGVGKEGPDKAGGALENTRGKHKAGRRRKVRGGQYGHAWGLPEECLGYSRPGVSKGGVGDCSKGIS